RGKQNRFKREYSNSRCSEYVPDIVQTIERQQIREVLQMTHLPYNIIAADLETDPFDVDLVPKPFLSGYFDGNNIQKWWNEKYCVDLMIDYMNANLDPSDVFLHNGGKFDMHYMIHRMHGKPDIINARVVRVSIGPHTFRDSYAILPASLKTFGGKLDIAYWKMHRDYRDQYKKEIEE